MYPYGGYGGYGYGGYGRFGGFGGFGGFGVPFLLGFGFGSLFNRPHYWL